MTIDPQQSDIGRSVTYTGNRYPGGLPEVGVITSYNQTCVFVRYGDEKHSKATSRKDLEWRAMTNNLKIVTVPRDLYYHEIAYVRGLEAEVARLQGHMRALADTSVARDTAGIFKGLWQGSEKECDELRAEVERLRAAGRVLVRRAESVITTDKAGNQFQHVFVDDLEALRAALEPKP